MTDDALASGKSGTLLERVEIFGKWHIVKHLRVADDWIMRATGDLYPRAARVYDAGILDRLPPCIDHTVVAAEHLDDEVALVMRDVSDWLLPDDETEVDLESHRTFLDHMAQMHATFWGWHDRADLLADAGRYLTFHPEVARAEAARRRAPAVPSIIVDGWARFEERAPASQAVVRALLDDPTPLVRALGRLPRTLVHGDWKFGNLGLHDDGRTILIDWAFVGEGAPLSDLTWYVALNRARLPEPKEATIDAYRTAAERAGLDTAPWWDEMLALCVLGAFVQFGWEKALGDDAEFEWWDHRAAAAARHLT